MGQSSKERLTRYVKTVLNGFRLMMYICLIRVKTMMLEEVGIYVISNLSFQKEVKLLEKTKTGLKSLAIHVHAENTWLGWRGQNI